MNTKTKLYSELKPRAIILRQKGKMYSEICDKLGYIPKSTLNNWLKNIELSEKQISRIKKIKTINGLSGRYIGSQVNHQKRITRLTNIKDSSFLEYKVINKHPLFLAGLLLYLAEGSKKYEQFFFMNSDPKLIQFMVNWAVIFGKLEFENLHFRLYIHELYKNENCEKYWINKLGINKNQLMKTIYKPTGRIYKKNPNYKGCMRLEVSGSELYWKTMAWRDCFYNTLH